MSDRLWLGPTAREECDVNLCEQPSILSAIKALQGLPGPRKVIGTALQIEEFRTAWAALYESEDEVWLDPRSNDVGWKVEA
jgi:hypothetical protein